MGKVQVLPSHLANMIAAGEVVGRPASVVKELMENAIDAGASEVKVIISDSGRTLIQVIDNGCGMSREDATLCFERHATSKLKSAEDLEQILTFGFRGEALASIAAVAEVTLKTRRPEDETATQVTIGSFGEQSVSQTAAPTGTSIAVRNLFYNTPARRKFLKSDNVEFKHIIEEFTHVAITRPEVAFSLSHNGRDVYGIKKAKSLKYRILDLLGSGVVGEVVDLVANTSLVTVSGYIGKPENARKSLGNQYLFVNGRYFKSPYFHKAIMNAYEEMVPSGLTPSYFIFLEVDPHSIDVNISPTKTEIKFEQDSVIFQTLFACIRETLGRNSFGASIDFDTEGAVQMPQPGSSFSAYKASSISPSTDFDSDYNPFDTFDKSENMFQYGETGRSESGVQSGGGNQFGGSSQYVSKHENYGALFEEKTLPSTQSLVLHGKYILTPVAEGLLMVHVRRAQTRILYEKLLGALKSGQNASSTTLFPVQAQIGAAQIPLIEEHMETLTRVGFEISVFGVDTIVVSAVPEGYSTDETAVRDCVAELLQILQEEHHSLPEMMQAAMARRFAQAGAASFRAPSGAFEATRLLDELFACDNPELTPAGKRISTIVPIEDIEHKF